MSPDDRLIGMDKVTVVCLELFGLSRRRRLFVWQFANCTGKASLFGYSAAVQLNVSELFSPNLLTFIRKLVLSIQLTPQTGLRSVFGQTPS